MRTRFPRIAGRSGQTLLELLFSISAVAVTVAAAGWMLKFEWDRGKCAYVVFEKTHAEAAHSPFVPLSKSYSGIVQIQDSSDSIQGSSQCGQSSESVSLHQLDPEAGL